jgi:hypothetical protein
MTSLLKRFSIDFTNGENKVTSKYFLTKNTRSDHAGKLS